MPLGGEDTIQVAAFVDEAWQCQQHLEEIAALPTLLAVSELDVGLLACGSVQSNQPPSAPGFPSDVGLESTNEAGEMLSPGRPGHAPCAAAAAGLAWLSAAFALLPSWRGGRRPEEAGGGGAHRHSGPPTRPAGWRPARHRHAPSLINPHSLLSSFCLHPARCIGKRNGDLEVVSVPGLSSSGTPRGLLTASAAADTGAGVDGPGTPPVVLVGLSRRRFAPRWLGVRPCASC